MIGLNIHGVTKYHIDKGDKADVLVVESDDGVVRIAMFPVPEDQDVEYVPAAA